MKKIITTVLIFLSVNVISQIPQNFAWRNNSTEAKNLFILVKGDVERIREYVQSVQGKFLNSTGDIASVKIASHLIPELLKKPFVIQVSSNNQKYVVMNDTMRTISHVNEVHAGLTPLTQSYKGRGVVIGIIDSGIDINHPDFKDSLGNTRIKWLWDMNLPDSANSPMPYSYGQEFSGAQIDAGQANAHTGQDQAGHGTYVTGIAAGNGRATGNFTGVAPESDLVIVGYDFASVDNVTRIAHAVEYIFEKADQLGKPCVINASLGGYDGSHDGLDLESQYIRNLINAQNGRVLIAACGNIGVTWPFHIGRNSVSGDTAFTWFNYTPAIGLCYVNIYADTADFNDVMFSIGADKVTPYYKFRGQTAFTSVLPSINNQVDHDLIVGGNRIGQIHTTTYLNGGVYQVEIIVEPDSTDYYWRFTTTGNGRYDSWTYYIFQPSWVHQNLPPDSVFPDMVKYHAPDTMQTIANGFNCLDEVISVGNFTNTDRHYDIDSVLQITATDYPRRIATNSGRGPTRDGRVKPEVQAPGNHIISAGVLSLIPTLPHHKVAPGGYHITGGGTSASAPVVAGIAALILEQNPNASWLQVKNAILTCAETDSLMWGPYPNNAWGFGKVNAFESLTTCAINTTTALLMNETAFSIYPNPVNSIVNINTGDGGKSIVIIYDVQGRILIEEVFYTANYSLQVNALKDGIYFLEIINEKGKAMKKIVVCR